MSLCALTHTAFVHTPLSLSLHIIHGRVNLDLRLNELVVVCYHFGTKSNWKAIQRDQGGIQIRTTRRAGCS